MTAKILVLDGDCAAALSIVQSLGRAGYALTLAAPSFEFPVFRSRFVSRAVAYPDAMTDRSGFQRWCEAQTGYDLIIPSSERTLIPLNEIRDLPALRGRLALPPPAAVAIGFDKELVRQTAERLGIEGPASVAIDRPDQLRTPLFDRWLARGAIVLKSVRSKVWAGDRGHHLTVRIATTREELLKMGTTLLESGPIQAQTWVPGHGIGICLLVDRGQTILSFAHERIHELPLTGGGSSYRRSIDPPEILLRQSQELLREIGWHGVAMVEFRYDPASGRSHFMEVNGRFWGSLALASFAGVDFPLALVRLLLGGELPRPSRVRKVYARQLRSDLEWLRAMFAVRIQTLTNGVPAPSERNLIIERPISVSLLEWGRLLLGTETWDGAALDDPWPITNEVASVVNSYGRGVVRACTMRIANRRAIRAWRRKMPPVKNLLVLCSGNICRSAYAGARLKSLLPPDTFQVLSGALSGLSGRPSPASFQDATRARGTNLDQHRSHAVAGGDLEQADLILVMDKGHEDQLRGSPAAKKVRWLGAMGEGSPAIADPVDLDREGIDRVLDQIDCACTRLAGRLKAPQGGEATKLHPRIRQRAVPSAAARAGKAIP